MDAKHGDRNDTALIVVLTNHDALKGARYKKKQFSSKQRAATTLGRRIPRLEMAMGKYPPGITTPYPYSRHKNNIIGSPIYTDGYGFTLIPIPMWVRVTHQVTRTHKS
jgi:hypothetical protein